MLTSFLLSDALYIVSSQLDTVEQWYRNFMADPTEEENVHKLRVSMRTLRSLIRFLKPFQDKIQRKFINAFLKEEARAISFLRELDSFKATWAALAETEGIVFSGSPLTQHLQELRGEEARRVMASISMYDIRENFACIRQSFKQWSNLNQNIFDYAVITQNRGIQDFQKTLHHLDLSNYDEIHDLRKDIKHLRYVQDNFPFLDENTDFDFEDFKALQDILGQMTDYFAHGAIEERIRKGSDHPALLAELDLFSHHAERAFQTALRDLTSYKD